MKIIIRFWGIKITITSRDIADKAQEMYHFDDIQRQAIIAFLDGIAAKYRR